MVDIRLTKHTRGASGAWQDDGVMRYALLWIIVERGYGPVIVDVGQTADLERRGIGRAWDTSRVREHSSRDTAGQLRVYSKRLDAWSARPSASGGWLRTSCFLRFA